MKQCICIRDDQWRILSRRSTSTYYKGHIYSYAELGSELVGNVEVYPGMYHHLGEVPGKNLVISKDKFEYYFTPMDVYRNDKIEQILDEKDWGAITNSSSI
jgi:hypothetical protein